MRLSTRVSPTTLVSSMSSRPSGYVADLPFLPCQRLTDKHQHYELIPQSTLASAEASLRDEISPHIALLLSRADAQIERQDRRIETFKARSELQQGRLAADDGSSGSAKSKAKKPRGRELSGEDKLRARAVRQRKEALRYGVERLELEVLQKERELRKRLDG